MKKYWKIGLSAFLAIGLLAACGEEKPKDDKPQTEQGDKQGDAKVDEATFPVTLTDATGKDITLEAPPKKIISLIPSNTEILFELGLNNEIVGVNDYDDYPAEAAAKEKVGSMEFNIEQIIALQPDVVFAHDSGIASLEGAKDQLESAGVKVFVVEDAKDFPETYKTIEQLGRATDKVEEAEKIVADMKAKVKEVQAKVANVEPKNVFIENGDVPEVYTPGKDTFMQEMLEMINAKNVAADVSGFYKIDAEQIIKKNPDVIIVTYNYVPDILKTIPQRPGFETVTAVKNNDIFLVDPNTTVRQGPRLADGLEELAKAIYPEAFNE
ncbi:MAG: ABC transporter substrate-binding protein [Lysinibacillus sp.]